MAASHHHQQSHHMNNIHRSSSKTANTACVMIEEEEDDLAALRIAALKTLEERKVKKEPRALIVQRNNVLVIEPQDNVNDFRRSPVARRFSRERSLSPVIYRRRSREASPNLRKSSPPLSRWSPRSNAHRRSPSPYHVNGGHHSPSHLSWNPNKRRSSPRAHSPRRMSHSPRRRSPGRRRTSPPCRRSPHRLCSPSRRSPRKSPQRSPLRRSPLSRSSPTRRSPRKSPARNSPRRFSPRRRLRDSSSSRQGKSTRRNGEKRRVSPPVPSSGSSSSVSGRRRTTSPRNKEPTAHSPDLKQAKDDVPLPSTKKGRFERFEDSVASDDESCNESLLDELFRETEETTAKTEALEAEPLDEDSQEKASADEGAVDGKMEDEDCLLLQADDDLDDLLVECTVPETVAVSPDPPCGHPGSEESRRGDSKKEGKQRDHDEKSRRRGRRNDHRRESSTEPAPRDRHARSERPARIDKKENRERKSKVPKEDHKTGVNAEKRKRSRSRDRDKSKRKPSHKTSLKPERQTSDSKLERPQSHHSKSRNHDSTEMDISVEDRERLEARKKKFLQKELKPSQKVISLKKSPTNKTAETDDVRRVQDRLGEPVKEPKRSPRSDDTPQTHSKSTILSRLGPPPASRANIKDRIGHINTNSSSPTRTPQAGMDAAQVKFEVRNRPTLDPKLKIHINLGGTLSTGSSSGSSKSKKVVCLE